MSQVFKAVRDDQQYEKQVAIKLLKPGLDTDSLLRRFKAERQILAQLSHPNIAHLLDGGATEDGAPYLVMEYIEGKPIDAYCDERAARRERAPRSVPLAVLRRALRASAPDGARRPEARQRARDRARSRQAARLRHREAVEPDADCRSRGAARDDVSRADARVRESRAGARRTDLDGERRLFARRVAVPPARRRAAAQGDGIDDVGARATDLRAGSGATERRRRVRRRQATVVSPGRCAAISTTSCSRR